MTEIHDATPADLERVSALDEVLFGADAWSPAAMAAEFAAAGETRVVLVATSGSALVGYAILLTVGDVADVQRVGVAVGAQRQGLGGRLLGSLISRAATAGCSRMLLEVDVRNAAAVALYTAHGFAEMSRRVGYYRGEADALVMGRDLLP